MRFGGRVQVQFRGDARVTGRVPLWTQGDAL